MPFLLYLLSFLLLHSFSPLLFLFQFSLFLALVAIPLFMATVSIFTGLILWDFSFLPPLLTNYFCLLWTTLQSCPLTYWLLNLHYTWACPVLSLSSTTHSMTNFNSFGSAVSLSFPFWWVKCLFLPTSLVCIKWSQPSITYFGKRCHPSKVSPSRGPSWIPKMSCFPPSTKPHPL